MHTVPKMFQMMNFVTQLLPHLLKNSTRKQGRPCRCSGASLLPFRRAQITAMILATSHFPDSLTEMAHLTALVHKLSQKLMNWHACPRLQQANHIQTDCQPKCETALINWEQSYRPKVPPQVLPWQRIEANPPSATGHRLKFPQSESKQATKPRPHQLKNAWSLQIHLSETGTSPFIATISYMSCCRTVKRCLPCYCLNEPLSTSDHKIPWIWLEASNVALWPCIYLPRRNLWSIWYIARGHPSLEQHEWPSDQRTKSSTVFCRKPPCVYFGRIGLRIKGVQNFQLMMPFWTPKAAAAAASKLSA